MQLFQEIFVGGFVITMMVGVGLKLTVDQLGAVFRQPRHLFTGLGLNYFVMPLVGLLVVQVLGLPPAVSCAILLLMAAPGAPIGIMMTQSFQGNLALTVALVLVFNVLNVVLTPILVGILGIAPPGLEGGLPLASMMQTIVQYLLLPLLLAMWWQKRWPGNAERWAPRFDHLSKIFFLGLVVGFGFAHGGRLFDVPVGSLLASLICVSVSFWLPWLLAGEHGRDRVALGMTTGVRAMSLVLLLITQWFPDPLTLLTALVYSAMQFWGCLGWAMVGRRWTRQAVT